MAQNMFKAQEEQDEWPKTKKKTKYEEIRKKIITKMRQRW